MRRVLAVLAVPEEVVERPKEANTVEQVAPMALLEMAQAARYVLFGRALHDCFLQQIQRIYNEIVY
jgi:hypothetical protein